MDKFIYNKKQGFKQFNIIDKHGFYINGGVDITIRGFINYKHKFIYIRINNISELYHDKLECKRLKYQFKKNYNNAINYINNNYKQYAIYNSYDILNNRDKIPIIVKHELKLELKLL